MTQDNQNHFQETLRSAETKLEAITEGFDSSISTSLSKLDDATTRIERVAAEVEEADRGRQQAISTLREQVTGHNEKVEVQLADARDELNRLNQRLLLLTIIVIAGIGLTIIVLLVSILIS